MISALSLTIEYFMLQIMQRENHECRRIKV